MRKTQQFRGKNQFSICEQMSQAVSNSWSAVRKLYTFTTDVTKNLRNENNDLLIISLCHEPICGDTTDQHKVILSQQITMYWPKVKTFSVHTAYYLCKKKVLSFTVDLSFYGRIVFNSDCNAHSDWLQQWYHIKNVAYIRRLTSESF